MPNVMAAQLNIGGAVCESSIIPFLAPGHNVWLTAAARVLCSNATNIGECKTSTQSEFCSWQNSVRGQEPPKMHIQCTSAGDDQTSCEVWLTSVEQCLCSNATKTRNRLKFTGVPETHQQISATSGPKFTILWGHVDEILLFNHFFSIVDICLSWKI